MFTKLIYKREGKVLSLKAEWVIESFRKNVEIRGDAFEEVVTILTQNIHIWSLEARIRISQEGWILIWIQIMWIRVTAILKYLNVENS